MNDEPEPFEEFSDKKIKSGSKIIEKNEGEPVEDPSSGPKYFPETNRLINNSSESPSNKVLNSLNKKIFLFGGLILLAMGVVILFAFFVDFSSSISDENLANGGLIELKSGKQINFNLGEEKHNLKIESVSENSIDLILQSEIIKANLTINETKFFDLNGDGNDDLELRLENISGGVPKLFIKKIEIIPCVEDWVCGDWGNCSNEIKTRICEDSNNCSTGISKPSESMPCVIENVTNNETNFTLLNCSALLGDICNSSEICNGTFLNATDSNFCCDEICILNETEEEINMTCESLGLFDYNESGAGLCESPGELTFYVEGGVNFSCCNIPLTFPIELSDELLAVWESINNSGNCTNYISSIGNCSLYKCNYFDQAFSGETFVRGIIGSSGGTCHGIDEINETLQYCQYNETQLIDAVNYETFIEEQCADGNCTGVFNVTGYFVNGILAPVSSPECVLQ